MFRAPVVTSNGGFFLFSDMNILDLARTHLRQILGDTSTGFAVSITFISPTGETVTGTGTHAKIHQGIDPQSGASVNVKKAHVTVHEKAFFIENGYPVRNAQGEVFLRGHRVQVADVTGIVFTYAVDEWFPDQTLGAIVVILKDFE